MKVIKNKVISTYKCISMAYFELPFVKIIRVQNFELHDTCLIACLVTSTLVTDAGDQMCW